MPMPMPMSMTLDLLVVSCGSLAIPVAPLTAITGGDWFVFPIGADGSLALDVSLDIEAPLLVVSHHCSNALLIPFSSSGSTPEMKTEGDLAPGGGEFPVEQVAAVVDFLLHLASMLASNMAIAFSPIHPPSSSSLPSTIAKDPVSPRLWWSMVTITLGEPPLQSSPLLLATSARSPVPPSALPKSRAVGRLSMLSRSMLMESPYSLSPLLLR
mmetsp:Transcript_31801/g.93388  ORF Transcript_31801/g.93388 Transcript_31801/m.93388 type:complete len:212 (+) Transcript_31801:1958-2593(+)